MNISCILSSLDLCMHNLMRPRELPPTLAPNSLISSRPTLGNCSAVTYTSLLILVIFVIGLFLSNYVACVPASFNFALSKRWQTSNGPSLKSQYAESRHSYQRGKR